MGSIKLGVVVHLKNVERERERDKEGLASLSLYIYFCTYMCK